MHSHNWGAWLYSYLASVLAGVPVFIHGEHGRDTESTDDGLLKRKVKSFLASRAAHLTTVSYDIAELIKNDWLLDSSKMTVIENGVDIDKFIPPVDRTVAKQKIGFDKENIVIGTVIGSFRPVKDLPTLFKALVSLAATEKNWILAIVGGAIQGEQVLDHNDKYAHEIQKLWRNKPFAII